MKHVTKCFYFKVPIKSLSRIKKFLIRKKKKKNNKKNSHTKRKKTYRKNDRWTKRKKTGDKKKKTDRQEEKRQTDNLIQTVEIYHRGIIFACQNTTIKNKIGDIFLSGQNQCHGTRVKSLILAIPFI